ncbi:MAG: hypothetical protein ACKO7P_16335, partial [Bacteroidota bacterium]
MKKNIFILSLIFDSFFCFSQIPVVYAVGGETKVNWDYREKLTLENEDDHPFLYGSGCTEAPSTSRASSSLASQGASTYFSTNLHDWNPRTAWVEGKSD